MDTDTEKQAMTLDDLAAMVARGFEDIANRMATKEDIAAIRLEMATKDELAAVEQRLKDELLASEQRLRTEIEGLRNSVKNYLHLSANGI